MSDYGASYPTSHRPKDGDADLGATLRRIGQSLDRNGRRLLTGAIDTDMAADLAATAVADLTRALARQVNR